MKNEGDIPLRYFKSKKFNPVCGDSSYLFFSIIFAYIICFTHAGKVLGEMTFITIDNLPVGSVEKHKMITATFSPNTNLMAMMQSYIAYIIPVVVSVAFSFILADEWEYKTIKIEMVYKDKNDVFFNRLCLVIVSTYILIVLTACFCKILGIFMWKNLIGKYEVLSAVNVNGSDMKAYIMLFFSIILTTIMYYLLAYLLTFGLGTNIPYIILIAVNTVKFDLCSYLPASLYKIILDNIFINNVEVDILTYLFNPSVIENGRKPINTAIHPVVCVYFYLGMSILALGIVFRKKGYIEFENFFDFLNLILW